MCNSQFDTTLREGGRRNAQARSATTPTHAAVPRPLQIKSPSSVPLVCTRSRRNPVTCGTNQEARNRRFGPALRRTGKIRQSTDACSRAAPPPDQRERKRVCVRERQGEPARERERATALRPFLLTERERERERERDRERERVRVRARIRRPPF